MQMQNWKITYLAVSKGKTLTWIATAETQQEARKVFEKKHPELVSILKVETVKI